MRVRILSLLFPVAHPPPRCSGDHFLKTVLWTRLERGPRPIDQDCRVLVRNREEGVFEGEEIEDCTNGRGHRPNRWSVRHREQRVTVCGRVEHVHVDVDVEPRDTGERRASTTRLAASSGQPPTSPTPADSM